MSTTDTPTTIHHAPRAQRVITSDRDQFLGVVEVTEWTTGLGIEVTVQLDTGQAIRTTMLWETWRAIARATMDLETEIKRQMKRGRVKL